MTQDPNGQERGDGDRDDHDREVPDGHDRWGRPEHESVPDEDRVPNAEWDDLVAGITSHAGFVPEMSADEIRERLEEDETWERPEPEPVGWRKAPPLFVLALVGVVGGAVVLFGSVIFLRPVSGFLVLVLIAVILGSGALLFANLPDERKQDGTGGARV